MGISPEWASGEIAKSKADEISPSFSLDSFSYHGHWCGPNWTGGRWEEYSKNRDVPGYYNTPKGALDRACQAHDKCFAECREQHPCGGLNKKSCMDRCDDVLISSSKAISMRDNDSSALTRLILEIAIGKHKGGDMNPSASCKME